MKTHTPTLSSYAIGYISSLALTVLAFWLVAQHVDSGHLWPPHPLVGYFVLGLAGLQFVIQTMYFLHIGIKKGQELTMGLFVSTLALVLVVIVGSIWIMNNLNYRMTPSEMNTHNLKEEGMYHAGN